MTLRGLIERTLWGSQRLFFSIITSNSKHTLSLNHQDGCWRITALSRIRKSWAANSENGERITSHSKRAMKELITVYRVLCNLTPKGKYRCYHLCKENHWSVNYRPSLNENTTNVNEAASQGCAACLYTSYRWLGILFYNVRVIFVICNI